jgi:hypothetical protein
MQVQTIDMLFFEKNLNLELRPCPKCLITTMINYFIILNSNLLMFIPIAWTQWTNFIFCFHRQRIYYDSNEKM